jgi:hypothetical protein
MMGFVDVDPLVQPQHQKQWAPGEVRIPAQHRRCLTQGAVGHCQHRRAPIEHQYMVGGGDGVGI